MEVRDRGHPAVRSIRDPGAYRSAPSYSPGATIADARAEALRRGDRRVGTEHILLAVLYDPTTAAALAVDLEHRANDPGRPDRSALAAVGLGGLPDVPPIMRADRGWLPISPAAKDVMVEALEDSGHARRGPGYVLLALLRLELPDAAAELLDALAVDRAAVHGRLAIV